MWAEPVGRCAALEPGIATDQLRGDPSSLARHRAGTEYVEALAAIGRVHPIFKKAGMERCDHAGCHEAEPVMHLFEEYGLDPTRCYSHDLIYAVNQLPTHHQKDLRRH